MEVATAVSPNFLESEVQAIVHALPEIVRGARPARGRPTSRLGVPQVRALLRLANADALTMGELARGMGVSCAAATQATDQLVDLKLVLRERPDWDRRVVLVRLTERARATVHHVLSLRTRQVKEVFAQLSPAERQAFVKGFCLLAQVLLRDLEHDEREPVPFESSEA